MHSTFDAIVLRPTPFQEGALVVSFLTDLGERVTGLAKGAKQPSAKWVAAFEPLSLVRLSLFGKEQSDLRRVTRCELQSSALVLGHLESSLVAGCLADLFDRVAREGVEDPRLFRLLSACVRAMRSRPDQALALLAYAEHWLLHLMGLLPHPRRCGHCGGEEAPLVLFTEEGWRCAACTEVDPAEALPPGSREHLRLLRTLPAEEAPALDPANAAQTTLTALLRHRLLQEMGGRLKSYEVLFRMV